MPAKPVGRKPRTKSKNRIMRFRKNDHTHNLLAAVARYVRANGGDLVVVGGIILEEFPFEAFGKFRIAVGCLGRKPIKKEAKR